MHEAVADTHGRLCLIPLRSQVRMLERNEYLGEVHYPILNRSLFSTLYPLSMQWKLALNSWAQVTLLLQSLKWLEVAHDMYLA